MEEEKPPELYPKSRVKAVGIGISLVLLLTTGIGAVLYMLSKTEISYRT